MKRFATGTTLCLLVTAAPLATASAVRADVIQLKDGRFYEGRVVEETTDTIVFEYVKHGISTKLTFKKREIVLHEKKPYPSNGADTQPADDGDGDGDGNGA